MYDANVRRIKRSISLQKSTTNNFEPLRTIFWHTICQFTKGVFNEKPEYTEEILILPLLFSSIQEQACCCFELESCINYISMQCKQDAKLFRKPVITHITFVKIVQVYYFIYLDKSKTLACTSCRHKPCPIQYISIGQLVCQISF